MLNVPVDNECMNVVKLQRIAAFLVRYIYKYTLFGMHVVICDDYYYADYDYDNWLVSPTPDLAYPFEVLYYERIQPLSTENQTNWLTRNAPNAMLYGTLLQAMPFLKTEQRTIFQQKYSEALQALSNEDKLRIADRQAIAQDS